MANDLIAAIQIGEIGAPHGINGAVRVSPTTDYPDRLTEVRTVWLNHVQGPGWSVMSWSWTGRIAVLQLEAVATREQAEKLRGALIVVPQASLPALEQGTYYWYELIGLKVFQRVGERLLGTVTHVHRRGGSHDFLEVQPEAGKPFWIPLTRPIVEEIDRLNGMIWVDLPEGLEDLT